MTGERRRKRLGKIPTTSERLPYAHPTRRRRSHDADADENPERKGLTPLFVYLRVQNVYRPFASVPHLPELRRIPRNPSLRVRIRVESPPLRFPAYQFPLESYRARLAMGRNLAFVAFYCLTGYGYLRNVPEAEGSAEFRVQQIALRLPEQIVDFHKMKKREFSAMISRRTLLTTRFSKIVLHFETESIS